MMKKWILLLMAVTAIHVSASDYAYKYLVFTKSDGTQTCVHCDGLTLSVDGNGGLVATNADGSTTLTLSSLSKMVFSTEETVPVEQGISPLQMEGPVDVYSLSGLYKGSFSNVGLMKSTLGRGIYVIQQNGKNTKMMVR